MSTFTLICSRRLLQTMLRSRITRASLKTQSIVSSAKHDKHTSRFFETSVESVKVKTDVEIAETTKGVSIIHKETKTNDNILSENTSKDDAKSKTKGKVKKRESVKIEYESNLDETGTSQKKQKSEPPGWRVLYENIVQMRAQRDAPVDTMGCDQLSDTSAEPKVQRYQLLLSLMLSSQTKDEVTSAAMERLRHHGCTVENILMTSDDQLGQLLIPVGFWRKKVVYIKKTSQILKDKYDCDIPPSIQEMCKLPGVGPKMAYLLMKCAWHKVEGIGVDVHVHRISNRLNWVNTKEPEQTRVALESWLPRELWSEINHLLVGFGQQTCLPVKPKCSECLNSNVCPANKGKKKSK